MELIAAVLAAGPLGYLGGRLGLALYLGLWAIIFPIQTVVVHAENPDDIVVAYFVVNAAILVLGIALNRLGARLRRRARDGRREARVGPRDDVTGVRCR